MASYCDSKRLPSSQSPPNDTISSSEELKITKLRIVSSKPSGNRSFTCLSIYIKSLVGFPLLRLRKKDEPILVFSSLERVDLFQRSFAMSVNWWMSRGSAPWYSTRIDGWLMRQYTSSDSKAIPFFTAIS